MKLPSLLFALLPAVLAACGISADHYDLSAIRPGQTRADEVRQRYGPPDEEIAQGAAGSIWEYSRQPEGRHCYMVHFDSRGVAREVRQVLNNESYRAVRDGMSREEIRHLLGKPANVVTFANLQEEVWEWHVEGDTPLEDTYFDVHFDLTSGGVKKTGKRVNPRG